MTTVAARGRSWWGAAANVGWWAVTISSVAVFGVLIIDVWGDATRVGFGSPLAMFGDDHFSLRPGEIEALQELGLNETAYASFVVARQVFLFAASLFVAVVIWHRVRTWVAAFVTLFLVAGNLMVVLDGLPDLGAVPLLLVAVGGVSLLGLLYVFPDGRHARLFGLLLGAATAFIGVGVALAGEQFFWDFAIVTALGIVGGGVVLQLRRLMGAGGPRYALLVTYLLGMVVLMGSDQLLPDRARAGSVELLWRLGLESMVLAVPLAVGLAIVWHVVRHGLWDVELALNRTAVYVSLSALLAGVYVVAVGVTQAGLRRVTGIDGGNTFGVVAATGLVALLVLPAQRRIQAVIDRVFFRRRFDVVRTLAVFSERLRTREELGDVPGDLVALVNDTFQPASVTLHLPRRQEVRP